MRRIRIFALTVSMVFLLCGCNNVEIFITPEPDYAVEVTDKELEENIYYVKNGTRFSKVYMPQGNVTSKTKTVKTNRVLYFTDGDEKKVPVHYKGEIIAYSSAKADLSEVTLERFKDMGYSIGIYGGSIGSDGYYHMTNKNVAKGSEAENLFNRVVSSEIRIATIGGEPIKDYVDKGSGIITDLQKDSSYVIEFYAGTYFYRQTFVADTHFLRAFEVYSYGKEKVSDTTHGYMCFNTPEDLKTGWYLINGQGLFQYHGNIRGESVEVENLNEGYYSTQEEMISAFSKQYNISVPVSTKDFKINVSFTPSDETEETTGYVVSPDGTVYDMDIDKENDKLSLTLAVAGAGDWSVYVYPKTLNVTDVSVDNDAITEETSLCENEFTLDEDAEYQMFYAEVVGEDSVYGSVIGPNGITYSLVLNQGKDENGNTIQYLYYRLPYAKAGTYVVRIYYYKSQTSIENVSMSPYQNTDTEIIIIE